MMKRTLVSIAFACSLGALSSIGAASTTTLLELDRGEGFDSIVFTGEYLYVGQSRKDFNTHYRVNIFNRADQQVSEIPLKHSATKMHKYGAGVIVVGTSFEPNLTFYTFITPAGTTGRFNTKVVQIPMDAWANDWLGTYNGREYFSDMGGNPNDEAGDNDPQLASQTIFSTNTSGSPRFMPTRMSGPMFGTVFGNDLIVARFVSLGSSTNYIARINLQSGAVSKVFDERFASIRNLTVRPNTSLVAFSEREAGNIVVGDLSTGSILNRTATEGATSTVLWYGKCLVASNTDTKTVKAYDASDANSPNLLATWDMSGTGEIFMQFNRMAIDEQTGRVYGKSAIACNPIAQDCSVLRNSVAVLDRQSSSDLMNICKI